MKSILNKHTSNWNKKDVENVWVLRMIFYTWNVCSVFISCVEQGFVGLVLLTLGAR